MEENKKQGFSSHTEDLPEEMLFSEDYDEDNVLYDTNARIYETDESDAVYDEENAEDDILYDADARYYEEFEENDDENDEPECAVVTGIAEHDCSLSPHDGLRCSARLCGGRPAFGICRERRADRAPFVLSYVEARLCVTFPL